MALLEDESDAHVLEAALHFVDENTPPFLRAPASESPLSSFTNENLPRDETTTASSSSIRTVRTYPKTPTMVPFSTKFLPLDLQVSFPEGDESLIHRKSAGKSNQIRDEAQYELAFLRAQVEGLESQLSNLKLNAKSTQNAVCTECDIVTELPRVWREIAIHQRHRRDEAQRENARLKIVTERQRKGTTNLCALLRKRLNQQRIQCFHGTDAYSAEHRLERVLDLNFDESMTEFEDLFGHLHAAYYELDAVFAANGLASMTTPTNDVHVREGASVRYFEEFANKLLPFSTRDTSEAAWDHFQGLEKHCGNGGLYEKAAKRLDESYTILEEFTKELFSVNSRADIKAKQVVRRYVEPDRDIILFISGSTPTEIKHKAIDGLIYHLRGYAVTKRFPSSTLDKEMSLLQICARVSIDYEPGVLFDPAHVRNVIRFLIGNVAGNIRSYQERIENALVDQVTRRR